MSPLRPADFAITQNAFLPSINPLSRLRNPYYSPWEAIVQNLPEMIQHRQLREHVQGLPILSTEYLSSEPEWQRCYTILAYIAHAYIWGGETPKEILPHQIAIPLLSAASHVETPPVLTCAAVNLWNYTLTGPDITNPDDLEIHTTFTGTESESWFLRVGTAIEARGADTIQPLLDAFAAVARRDYPVITGAMYKLRDCLDEIAVILGRMHEKCDPMIFCHQIRPFYAGSKDVCQAGLPRGVFYDEGNGNGEWLQLPGGSNGQSALIQLFDIVLGVGYNKSDSPDRKQEGYYRNTRECTPGPHRRFLELVGEMDSIRELAMQTKSKHETDDAKTYQLHRLKEAYATAAEALANFRTKHIQIVTRFIAMQLKNDWDGSAQSKDMPELLPSGLGDDARKGTAGTTMLQFLKRVRNETTAAGKLAG